MIRNETTDRQTRRDFRTSTMFHLPTSTKIWIRPDVFFPSGYAQKSNDVSPKNAFDLGKSMVHLRPRDVLWAKAKMSRRKSMKSCEVLVMFLVLPSLSRQWMETHPKKTYMYMLHAILFKMESYGIMFFYSSEVMSDMFIGALHANATGWLSTAPCNHQPTEASGIAPAFPQNLWCSRAFIHIWDYPRGV